jgi:Spy/CpxP family protein refolding chaperone
MAWKAGSTLMTLSLVVTALLFTSAGAQPPGRWGTGPAGLLPLMLRSANLTPDQDAKVKELVAARRAAARSLMQQLRQAEDELADKLLAPGSVKAGDLQPQIQLIAHLREQLLRDSTQAALDIRAILTSDQLARVAQTKDRLRQLQSELRQLWPAER